MSRYTNDDNNVLYSANYGPIISDNERKVLENKMTTKTIDIPRPLADELKNLRYIYINKKCFNFNESMIIRVGIKIILETISDLILNTIHDEDGLVKSLWHMYKLDRDAIKEQSGSLYSRNVKSITDSKFKYELSSITKTIRLPYSLFAEIKIKKSELEKETGDSWIKENTFCKLGLMLMIDLLKKSNIQDFQSEDELLMKIKKMLSLS